jgi:hypothetical protein
MNREQYQKKFKLHQSKIEQRLDLAFADKLVTYSLQKSFPEMHSTQTEFKKKLKLI